MYFLGANMQRKIYFTVHGGPEQSINIDNVFSPSEPKAIQAVMEHLNIHPILEDRYPGSKAPTLIELSRQALQHNGVEILRVS
jgi:hypothetical protein